MLSPDILTSSSISRAVLPGSACHRQATHPHICGAAKEVPELMVIIPLPLISPVVMILTITKTIWALQTFDLVHIMTGGGPASGTELMSVYIQKNTFKYLEFGYGAAMSFILMLVCLVLTVIYIRSFTEKEAPSKKRVR